MPRAIALLLVRRFIHALLLAVAAIGCSAEGVAGVYLDSAPAPTIVVLFTALFVVAFVASTIRDSQTENFSNIPVAANALPGLQARLVARLRSADRKAAIFRSIFSGSGGGACRPADGE